MPPPLEKSIYFGDVDENYRHYAKNNFRLLISNRKVGLKEREELRFVKSRLHRQILQNYICSPSRAWNEDYSHILKITHLNWNNFEQLLSVPNILRCDRRSNWNLCRIWNRFSNRWFVELWNRLMAPADVWGIAVLIIVLLFTLL